MGATLIISSGYKVEEAGRWLLRPQSLVSRHLRYLFNADLVTRRRDRQSVYYRIAVVPGSREHEQLQLLREMLADLPSTQALRQRLRRWLRTMSGQWSEWEDRVEL